MTEIRLSALYSVAVLVFCCSSLLSCTWECHLQFSFLLYCPSCLMSYQNLPQWYLNSLSASFDVTVEIHNLAKIYYSLLIDCDVFGLQHLFNIKLQTTLCYKLENQIYVAIEQLICVLLCSVTK